MKFSVITIFALISLTAAVKDFQPKNADDAEKLTEDFKKLTPDSPCKEGDQACVNDQFAQCVGGKFALNSCGGGNLKCVVLPLVNKPGTSITCSTEEDRQRRLADARGETPPEQPKGNDNKNIETPDQSQNPKNDKGKGDNAGQPDQSQNPENDKGKGDNAGQPDQSQNPENDKGKGNADQPGDFRKKNADDAEKLTEDFKKLTPDSPCKEGDQACVNDQFAQCVGGKFALNSCGGGNLKCVVLPLVNKPGTSITCSTEEDRQRRLADARGETPPEQPKGNDNKNIETPDQSQNPKNDKGKNDNAGQPDQSQNPENDKGNDKSNGNTAEIRKKNADEAEKKQEEFKSFTPDQKCTDNEIACIDNKLAQCANEKFVLTECGSGLQCSVLPLVLKEGTTVACTTEADRQARLKEARNNLK